MSSSFRLRIAAHFALWHWVLLALLQWQNFWYFLAPLTSPEQAFVSFAVTIPWLQTQNLLAATCLGYLAYLTAQRAWSRYAFFAFYAALMVFLILNQLHYRFFLDNFRFSSVSEGINSDEIALLWTSLKAELDWIIISDTLYAAFALVVLGRGYCTRPCPRPGLRVPWLVGSNVHAIAAILFLAGIPSLTSAQYFNLQHHPLCTLLSDAWRARFSNLRLDNQEPIDLSNLPGPEGEISVDRRLADAAATIRQQAPRPNVLLVVLESVGKYLLTDEGRPSPIDTPNIAKLCEHAIIFDSIYTIFPATSQAHTALHTGGRFQTSTPIQDVIRHDFNGPTLPRIFQDRGYRTALICSYQLGTWGAMDKTMSQMGYQFVDDFATDPGRQHPENCLGGWSAKEEYTIGKIQRWIKAVVPAKVPFLVTYDTDATHHPYRKSPDHPALHPPTSEFARYRNALHYTDACLERLFQFLKKNADCDNDTLIVITGDHGQAFGDPHPGNKGHGHYLYEESVRGFLIIAHPSIDKTICSNRIGSVGDIAPTLAALAGLPPPDMPGKNLLTLEYDPRFVFFYTLHFPEKWGLRDDRWKFIQSIRSGDSELYDLNADPSEQDNLASKEPQRTKNYQVRCEDWFRKSDQDFLQHLSTNQASPLQTMAIDNLRMPGLKKISIGVRRDDDDFENRRSFRSLDKPAARTLWVSYPEDKAITFVWCLPSGHTVKQESLVTNRQNNFWMSNPVLLCQFPGPFPLQPGLWQLKVLDGTTELSKTSFYVQR